VHGSDRKTPVDGVPADPELTETEQRSMASPPAGPGDSAPLPDSLSPGASAPLGDVRTESSVPTPARSEAVTPQGASIATEDAGKAPARGRFGRWSRAARRMPLVAKAVSLAGGALALLGAIFLPRLFGQSESTPVPRASAAPVAGGIAGLGSLVDGGPAVLAETRTDASFESFDGSLPDAGPITWRIGRLADDPSVVMVDIPIQHHPLLAALSGTRVSRGEGQRLVASISDVHGVDRFGPKDMLTVAVDKSTGSIVAYELASSPADVWQGREELQPDGTPKLLAKKLKLDVQRVRVRKAVLVGADLHASFVEAGLASIDDLLAMLDDALEGHAELSDVRPGARLRIVAMQDQVDGAFVRWVSLEAVEYFPAAAGAPSVRVYRFGDDDDADDPGKRGADSNKRRGWYDAKGRQPYHGGWRSPVPLARITSRFNPHRMHPVLHVVMPHNGVDFAAPVGAPVYATAAGVVTSVGPAGPCGNRVEISHPGNVQSIYCHLSRFATGLHVGLHVEQRQLIAYVGQTGRVTGPHLHFGIRKNGMIVDPMTLRLDGMRVIPRGSRDEFDRQRAELDAELDSVALPASTGVLPEAPEQGDSFYEEP
jgi:hypothetical protein